MHIKPPFEDIQVELAGSGFYRGLNKFMTIGSKVLITILVLWAAVFSDQALSILSAMNSALLRIFNAYYVYVVTFFLVFCIVLAITPVTGKLKLGKDGEKPEYSNFSWFSMMFSAGMGIGLMVFSTAEPLLHFGDNPEIINGKVEPYSHEALPSTFRYAFLHYGLHPWGIYVVTGLCMAYFAHRRNLPLTIRTTLIPLFGRHLNGYTGHLLDMTAIIATLLGVAVTIGYGVSQLVTGFNEISGFDWLLSSAQTPTKTTLIVALLIVMILSIISAATGIGRGIKYLSNLNLVLSLALLLVFLFFGPLFFSLKLYISASLDYLISLPDISTVVYQVTTPLGDWQETGTILYWAWWVAFAPFVGLFLARISKGRSIREFVFGAMFAPAAMCFVWMVLLGGAAVNLELSGVADGRLINASASAQLFETLNIMLSSNMAKAVSILSVVLILTFLVTSADSGVLVLNTIMAGGNNHTDLKHKVIWGLILTIVIGTLLIVGGGGLEALQKAMIIGALPFSMVMALMCIAIVKQIIHDRR
ncbi:MAG: BCCT family transporter [Betaproteobacteria bacterium]|nr:BCCT family transporter [Betaproteobacteria bacterium]